MQSYTWLFRAEVFGDLDCSPSATVKALLDSRKKRQEECLGVADTITFTCSELSVTEPRTISVQGFVHGNGKIGECSLKQWLPTNHIPELKEITFEAVHPGHGQLDPRYRKHPTIKKFLDETSLEPSVVGNRLRFDFYGSSAEVQRPHLEEAHTWFLHARACFTGSRNFSNVLVDQKHRQEASLQAASFIAYACSDISGPTSEHPGTVQVEVLIHSKTGHRLRRGTLETWLPLGGEIQEMVCEPIRPGMRKPFMSDPTVQKFYDETALAGDPAARSRRRTFGRWGRS